jgi:tRNA A-37 threonylcarbamoyl transferase component Bud32
VNKEYQDVLTSQVLNTLITLEGVTTHNVVRTLSSRTVYYLIPSSPEIPALYLKEYQFSGIIKALKGLFFPPAEREYQFSRLLAERGVSTFTPLAVGTVRKGGLPRKSYLLSKSIEGAQTFRESIRDYCDNRIHLTTSDTRCIIFTLANFIRGLHQRGIVHQDFHWENILMARDEQGAPHFYLMDLHRVKVKPELTKKDILHNLASLNTALSQKVRKTKRLQFLKAYGEQDRHWEINYPYYARVIETITERMLKKLWHKRTTRCLRENKYYAPFAASHYRGFFNREYHHAELLSFFCDPDRAFHESISTIIKDSYTTSSCSMSLPCGGNEVRLYIKRYNYQNFFYALKYLFRRSRAKRVWRVAHGLLARAIPTPRPIAFVEKRRGGVLIKSFYIAQHSEGVLPLTGVLKEGRAGAPPGAMRMKRELLYQAAGVVRKMHERGVCHRDLKASNILVRGEEGQTRELYLVDLDSATIKESTTKKEQIRDLTRLNTSLLNPRMVSTTDRLRFLKCYLNVWRKRDYRVRAYWEETLRETHKKLKKTGKTFA